MRATGIGPTRSPRSWLICSLIGPDGPGGVPIETRTLPARELATCQRSVLLVAGGHWKRLWRPFDLFWNICRWAGKFPAAEASLVLWSAEMLVWRSRDRLGGARGFGCLWL